MVTISCERSRDMEAVLMKNRTGGTAISRRRMLRGMAALGGMAAGTLLVGQQAWAQKSSKQALQYQEQPKNGQKCSDCEHFIPGGTCRLVEGDISPEGWCTAFAPKT